MGVLCAAPAKLNIPSSEPAMLAAEPGIWPSDQFCSTNLMIDDWSVSVWLDEVRLGPRRDDEQRQARAVAAAALLVDEVGRPVPHVLGAGQDVGRGLRRVGHPAVHVVVPAVRVVVGDDDRGARPGRQLLERVDLVDDEVLLVDRVGVGRVAVLVAGRLQEADGRQVRSAAACRAWMAATSASKSLMSYWWLAVSNLPGVAVSVPTADSDVGARWCGLAVDA